MTEPAAPGAATSPAAAVHHLALPAAAVAALRTLGEAADLRVYDIDLAGCVDKPGLLERAAAALAFPAWFGHNWDAWFDCLTDLGWQPPALGHVLLLRNAGGLHRAAPEALDTALAIVEDAAGVWARRGGRLLALVDTGG